MASDKRLGTKLPIWADRDKTAGMRFDTATYVGVVKNNIGELLGTLVRSLGLHTSPRLVKIINSIR
jgi:hypothetical protein